MCVLFVCCGRGRAAGGGRCGDKKVPETDLMEVVIGEGRLL